MHGMPFFCGYLVIQWIINNWDMFANAGHMKREYMAPQLKGR